MASSYAQRKAEIKRALRQTKSSLNVSNAMLEKTRREADRLITRKTMITPDSLDTLSKHWDATVISANAVTTSLTRLFTLARSYL